MFTFFTFYTTLTIFYLGLFQTAYSKSHDVNLGCYPEGSFIPICTVRDTSCNTDKPNAQLYFDPNRIPLITKALQEFADALASPATNVLKDYEFISYEFYDFHEDGTTKYIVSVLMRPKNNIYYESHVYYSLFKPMLIPRHSFRSAGYKRIAKPPIVNSTSPEFYVVANFELLFPLG